jgi:hypothetical protein
MINYKFTNAGGVDVEYLTDGQGDATNELHVVEIRGLESIDTINGLDFDIYPYTEEQFKAYATANNLKLTKFEDEKKINDIVTQSAYTVDYTEVGTVASIVPDTVTFAADEFTVPATVVGFTFSDNEFEYEASFDGWNWTITQGDSSANDILTFVLEEQTGEATINDTAHTVAIEVENGTVVTALEPTITVSEGATIAPLSGAAQDFTSPVTYTVTAENEDTQEWVVTVTVA